MVLAGDAEIRALLNQAGGAPDLTKDKIELESVYKGNEIKETQRKTREAVLRTTKSASKQTTIMHSRQPTRTMTLKKNSRRRVPTLRWCGTYA